MAWFFLSRLASSAVAFIVVLVLARMMEPADFGRFNMLQLSATVAFAVLLSWAGVSTIRFYHSAELEGRALPVAFGTLLCAVGIGLPVVALAALVTVPSHISAVIGGAVFCGAHALHEVGLAGLRVLKSGPRFALSMLVRPLVGTALSVMAILRGGGAEAVLLSMATGAVLSALLSWSFILRREGLSRPSASVLRPMVAFGVPLGIVTSGTMMLSLVSQFLLGLTIDLNQVGYFAAAQVVTMRVITMPMITLAQAADASIFESAEAGGSQAVVDGLRRYASFLLLCSAPIAVLMIFANNTIAVLIFGGVKGPAIAPHMPPLGLAAFLVGIQGAFFAFAFTISKKSIVQLFILPALIVIHGVTTIVGLALFGALGASYGALATAMISLTIYVEVGARFHRVSLPVVELRQIGYAVLAAVPFGIAADMLQSSLQSLAMIALGGCAFFLLLHLQKHLGLGIVLGRAMARLKP